jgi:Uma2 family endonuclease
MSTIATIPAPEVVPQPRLLTVADVALFPDDLPSGAVKYELDDGRLVIMPPPGDDHSVVGGRIFGALLSQGEWRGHGQARTEVGLVLRLDPDRLVGPDAAFVSNASLPVRKTPEGYLETVPELIVEVRSKNDTVAELERKASEYVAAGAKLVWVVDPLRQVVVAFRPGQEKQTYGPEDVLTADGIIPEFRLPVRDALQV